LTDQDSSQQGEVEMALISEQGFNIKRGKEEAFQKWITDNDAAIKKVVSDRGFGFIAAEDGKEYFFHRDGLDRSLEFDRLVGGEKVNFEVESSPRGPRAGKVSAA
jgi:CspA family cold shock protein